MATLPWGDINVDTAYLNSLAAGLKAASDLLGKAASDANRARAHENWKCNERYNVSNEIDLIKSRAERIEKYMESLAAVIKSGAGDFEAAQRTVISGLGDAALKTK